MIPTPKAVERPKTVVIFHRGCWDGFGAAMIASRHLQDNVELCPGSYGDRPPNVRGRRVLILDFSYPPEVMQQLAVEAARVTWIDHHHTAIEAMRGVEMPDTFGSVLDLDRSGIGLTWDALRGGRRPWVVDHIEDRDLWRRQQPDGDAVNLWIRSHEQIPAEWEQIEAAPLDEAAAVGRAMLTYHHRLVTNAAAAAPWVEIGGERMPMATCSYDIGSDVADQLIERTGSDVAGYFLMNRQGEWQYGFRSRADYDCSVLAQRFGGGGHRQAAGCRSSVPLHQPIRSSPCAATPGPPSA